MFKKKLEQQQNCEKKNILKKKTQWSMANYYVFKQIYGIYICMCE